MGAALDAMLRRRSYSRVTEAAPSHDDLLPLIAGAARVADHSSLRPWRVIELRGAARNRLGAAFAKDAGASGKDAEKFASKPKRAELLLAIVFVHRKSDKVPAWEQEAVAAGVAHTLSLLLDDAGWGVFWRTGVHTRSRAVHKMHKLEKNEALMGWLYVGAVSPGKRSVHHSRVDPSRFLSVLD